MCVILAVIFLFLLATSELWLVLMEPLGSTEHN